MGKYEEFTIEVDQPLPIKNVKYNDVLRLKSLLEKLPIGGSFHVKKELTTAVRKLAKDHFPEYGLTIRNMGYSYMVFRKA